MRRRGLLRAAAIFAAILLAAILLVARAEGAPVRHVVLVSIDGLAASYLDDPKADLPTLRQIRKVGSSAAGMITTFPSVTWPSHTSLITGTRPRLHGVLANRVYDRRSRLPVVYIGDPELTKDQAIHVPTLYDFAHAAGLKTASVIWPCGNGAKSLDWVIPDSEHPRIHAQYTTPGLVRELAAGGIDISQLGAWGWKKEYGLRRDKLYAQAACFLLEKKGINLLLVHFVSSDGVQHLFGPRTFATYQVMAFEDRCLKQIWDTIRKPALASDSTLFVVSDHGFADYEKVIEPNIILKRRGLIELDGRGEMKQRRAWTVSNGGSAFVYLFDDKAISMSAELAAMLGKLEGVERVLKPSDFAALGLPDPNENSQMPQLILTTRPGFSFGEEIQGEPIADAKGYKGTHGHLPRHPFMHATFVAAGAGIRPGVRLKTIENIDVAPTIANLLQIPLPSAEGRVLREILAK